MSLSHPLIKRILGIPETEISKVDESGAQSQIGPASPDESTHINQEMYKKGVELSEKNKTLSLLEKINELIQGSITNLNEIANQVTMILVNETDFVVVAIYLYDKDKNILIRLTRTQIDGENAPVIKDNKQVELSLDNQENLIVQAVKKHAILYADSSMTVFVEPPERPEQVKSVFIAPLFARGELIGALTIAMNVDKNEITEYRRDLLGRLAALIGLGIDNAQLYNEVQSANNKLQVANEKLKALDKLKNEFVSVASHELRTPMTAIKSYLWMALNDKGGPLNEKQKYYVERGYNSVDRLIRLVNDMLNISRIESGRITIELQSVDLITLTQEVIEEVLPRAQELGVTVTMQKPEGLPHVLADPDKIKEVIFNLIGNSLKFTPRGGTITISYSRKDDFIETRVTDNGAGIAPEDMGKLFQKFGLIEGSYITNQTSTSLGTGLGLYICRSIIDLHQGEIKAESEGRGKGSTFMFTLKEFNESDLQTLKLEKPDEKKEKVDLIHVQL